MENGRYILPGDGPFGIGCAKEVETTHPVFRCGCPTCLSARGATLVYKADDMSKTPERRYWGRIVVSEKIGLLAKENIVPGYPGGVDLDLPDRG